MNDNESIIKKEIAREYASRSAVLYREKRTYPGWRENILYVEAEILLFFRQYGNAKRVKGLIETCTRESGLWLVQRNGQDWKEGDLLEMLNTFLQAT